MKKKKRRLLKILGMNEIVTINIRNIAAITNGLEKK